MFAHSIPKKFITPSIASGMSKFYLFHFRLLKTFLINLHLECRNLVLQFPFIGIPYSLFYILIVEIYYIVHPSIGIPYALFFL